MFANGASNMKHILLSLAVLCCIGSADATLLGKIIAAVGGSAVGKSATPAPSTANRALTQEMDAFADEMNRSSLRSSHDSIKITRAAYNESSQILSILMRLPAGQTEPTQASLDAFSQNTQNRTCGTETRRYLQRGVVFQIVLNGADEKMLRLVHVSDSDCNR